MNSRVLTTRHVVQFSDLDANYHMTTVRYLEYFLDHRFQAYRDEFGWTLKKTATFDFVVFTQSVQLQYLRAVKCDELIRIESSAQKVDETKVTVLCQMWVEGETKKPACTAEFVFVCMDKKTLRPCAWPESVKETFWVIGSS